MSKLNKVLGIILVLQYSKASPCFDDSNFESGEYNIPDCVFFPTQECPEGQSLISNNDLNALLNYVVKRSHIVEDIINSYHDKFVALSNKHLDKLNEFQEQAENEQNHLKHILESIEDSHRKLEPIGRGIAAEIEKIDVSEERVFAVDNNLEKLLKKFQMFQDLCEINGINQELVNTLIHNFVFKSSNANLNFKPICGSIEVIYAEAIKRLHDLRDEIIATIESHELKIDDSLKDSVISYNDHVKNGALIQYNNLMYDILKLQDGYFHLNQYFSNFNLSSKLEVIENNTQKVESMLVEMDNNIDEYGKICMNSVKNIRIQRDSLGSSFKADNYPEIELTSSDIIDAAISIKIEEIEDTLQNNFTNIFKELRERLTNPEVIESYIQKLAPKEEDVDSVKEATEKMNELKKIIPESTFKKLQDLYRKSEQLLQKAAKAKEDIEAKIKSFMIQQ